MSPASVVLLGGYGPGLLHFRGALMRAMIGRGCRVTACAPESEPDLRRAMARLGVDYRPVSFVRTALRPDRDLRLLGRLFHLFRELRPDAVLTNTIKPVIYGSLAARAAGVPRICALISGLGAAFGEAGGIRTRLLGLAAEPLYRCALSGNHRVLFQNPDDRDHFLDRQIVADPDRAILVNGSGVDLAHFAAAPPVLAPNFLMIARLIAAKGVRDYAAAAALVRRRHPEARFRLIGWFDDTADAIGRDELERWAAAGDIEFLGRLEDVRGVLADSAVMVLPSYYREGVPRTLLEALAMGRPILTTDRPGCRETVVDGVNGWLVPPRDPAALASAMTHFIETPDLIPGMGAAGRRLAETRFDVRSVNRVVLEALGL